MSELPENININPEINIDIVENLPFQEGVISEAYQRPDKSFFQEPQELDSLVNTGRLVQKFIPKQPDTDKILKIIQRKVPKGMHLPVTIKEIQAGYLVSPYFKHICPYLPQNKLPNTKAAIQEVETLVEKYIILYLLLFKILNNPRQRNGIISYTRGICRQDYYPLSIKLICRTSWSNKNISYYGPYIFIQKFNSLPAFMYKRLLYMSLSMK